MKPKEDPTDKADRLRERRLSLLEQMKSSENSAKSLTSDLRGVYGLKSLNMTSSPKLPSMFGSGR